MPLPTADEILTQQHKRYYYQLFGPGPENRVFYGGLDGQYLNIESVDNPQRGDISPINVGDPRRNKQYRRVAREVSPADFPTATVNFLESHGAIPRQLYDMADCVVNFYELANTCNDPSSFLEGWSAYVKVFSQGENTARTEGGSAFDGDTMVQDDLDFTFGAVYTVGPLGIGEKAAVTVYSEVKDVVYGSRVQCGDCGPSDSGTKLIYAVTDNTVASPGEAPDVVYSVDGGDNWTVLDITGAASTDSPVAIDIVGQYLVVLFRDGSAGGYFYAAINQKTGVPGTWTKVTSGFVAGNLPTDMYVASPREVFISADNGYVYKAENILSGVTAIEAGNATAQNLNRIDGYNSVVVACGESGAVVFSENRGETWATTTNDPGAAGNDALEVIDENRWWVGNDAGVVYWTNNQGESAWNTLTLPASAAGTLATIQDILFATDEVGYIVAASSDPTGALFVTYDGGRTWGVGEQRIANTFPTLDQVNRLAIPDVSNYAVRANNVAFGGLAGNGSDGIILLGIAAVK